jgi:hypothetical protein
MSALPPKADITFMLRHVRFGPSGDIAPPHSITSSACASVAGGTLKPRAVAAFKLITISNLTGA